MWPWIESISLFQQREKIQMWGFQFRKLFLCSLLYRKPFFKIIKNWRVMIMRIPSVFFSTFYLTSKALALPWIESIFLFHQRRKIQVWAFLFRKTSSWSSLYRKPFFQIINNWRVMIMCIPSIFLNFLSDVNSTCVTLNWKYIFISTTQKDTNMSFSI